MAVVLQKISKSFYDYKCVVLTLTQENIDNGYVTLPNQPNTSLPFSLYPAGGPRQLLGEAYGLQGSNVLFTGFGFENLLIAGDRLEVCYFTNELITSSFNYKCVVLTLTLEDIENKRVKLDSVPDMSMPFQLYPAGGTKQILGEAYNVEDDYVVFDGYGFDGIIVEGDRLEVCYFSNS